MKTSVINVGFILIALTAATAAFAQAESVPSTALTPAQQVRQAWVARYNGPGNGWDYPTALAVDAQGNVYVTGRAWGSDFTGDFATFKYDPAGNPLWEQHYYYYGGARALAVDARGNVYVTGEDYATLKYDRNGNLLWERHYNGTENGYDYVYAIAVDAQGNVYVTGTVNALAGADYATLKYDSNGNLLWERRYNGPGNGNDSATALAMDAQGNVYVTGTSQGNGTNDDYATLKYDSAGNLLWERRYNGPSNDNDSPTALAVDAQGNAYVTGTSVDSVTSEDYATLKYDRNGNSLWEQRYNGPTNFADQAHDLAVDAQGSVYVTGTSFIKISDSYYNADFVTLKYDSAGNPLWEQRYDYSYDTAVALAVDAQGNVYVTGSSEGIGTGWDYATLKYDSIGNLLWEQRYNSPGDINDNLMALAVDVRGNVYVTGYSGSSRMTADYATVKYSQGPEQQPAQ